MTQQIIKLQQINEAVKQIMKKLGQEGDICSVTGKTNLVFQATFTNYTPFMPGDYDTTTFKKCQKNNREQCEINMVPLAQQIIGKMRWLLRTALASLPQCSQYDSYKEIEENCLTIKVIDNRDSKKGIPIMDLLFGTINGKQKQPRAALYKLVVLYSPYSKVMKKRWNIASDLERNLTDNTRNVLQNRKKIIRWDKKRNIYVLPDRYNAQLSRKSPERGIQNSVEYIQRLSPISPRELRVTIKVYENASLIRNIVNAESARLVRELYVGLLIGVLSVLGLGKAANRGFGRFVVDEETSGKFDKKLSNEASRLLTMFSEGEKDSIKQILINIQKIVNNLSETEGVDAGNKNDSQVNDLRSIPTLNYAISNSESVEYRYNYSSEAVAINDALEAIAASVLKHCRKSLVGKGNWFRSGANIHTWILGLPRMSKITCFCSNEDSRQRNVRHGRQRTKDNKMEFYGYIILNKNSLNLDDSIVRKIYGGNACVPSKHCIRNSVFTTEDLIGMNLDLRRQSMVILFPIPPNKQNNNKRPDRLYIYILPFFSRDMEFAVYPFDSNGRQNLVENYRNLGMFHISGHSVRDNVGRRKGTCCNTHIQSVWRIIKEASLMVKSNDCRPENSNIPIYCGEGRVPGDNKDTSNYLQVYNEILIEEGLTKTRDCLIEILRFSGHG